MEVSGKISFTKIVLNNGLKIPALGFGTLIPDPSETENAVKVLPPSSFRLF